jgi:hypothetical protein
MKIRRWTIWTASISSMTILETRTLSLNLYPDDPSLNEYQQRVLNRAFNEECAEIDLVQCNMKYDSILQPVKRKCWLRSFITLLMPTLSTRFPGFELGCVYCLLGIP